jgi:hypothetical protein
VSESLYTTETPASETSESPGPTIGTVIKITAANKQITALKWYAPAESTGDDGAVPFVLYDADTQDELARKVVAITLNAWNTAVLDTPYATSLNQRIIAAVKTNSRYVYTSGFFSTTDLVVGNLTAPATGNTTGGNGRFHTGGDAYPESTFGGNNYWTDIVLDPLDTDAVAPDSLSVPVSFGAPAVTQPFTAAPDSLSVPLSLGAPAVAQSLAVAPNSLSVPVSLGAPSVGMTVRPDSLTVPLTLGEPAVDGPRTVAEHGSWDSLLGVLAAARGDAAFDAERIAHPLDCPVHGWPLERARGVLHCRFGGHVL